MSTPPNAPHHLSGDQFRALAHRAADWIADYWEHVEKRPVLSRVKPGEVISQLPTHAPQTSNANEWDAIFADLDRIVMPGLTHWQHPNFYAFFSANASGPAVIADFICAGLGVQGMLWATSPACTEVEQRMMDWLGAAIGLPDRFLFQSGGTGGGVIAGTASESTLIALLAARARGRTGNLVAYASSQAHSSVMKAAMIAGIAKGPDDHAAVRMVPVDKDFRMRPDALEAAIREDLASGKSPFYVCATVGTTGVTAVDPIADIALALRRVAPFAWLHVDAAHSGAACICEEHRWMLRGVEHVDSLCFNPHKWLLTNFDCGCLWVARRDDVTRALSISPEYLRNAATESGAVVDYRDWHIPLGRRFRALKLWFVMRHYGLDGLQAYIREHVRLAQLVESWINADPRFVLAAPRIVNLVCFRLREGGDAATKALMDRVNAGGRAYLTHTTIPAVDGEPAHLVIRMAISGTLTQERHVRETWSLIAGSV